MEKVKFEIDEVLDNIDWQNGLYLDLIKDKDDSLVKSVRHYKDEAKKDLEFNLSSVSFNTYLPSENGEIKVNGDILITHFGALDFEKLKQGLMDRDELLIESINKVSSLHTKYKDASGNEVEFKVPRIKFVAKFNKELLDKYKYTKNVNKR